MKILIGSDFVPTASNEQLFIEGNINELFGDALIRKLSEHDYRIFNLEVPLINKANPIKKCGPNLIAREETINSIKKINVNLFTLANNHIYDQGNAGIENTQKILDDNSISYVGVGKNIEEAKKPFFIDAGNHRIGIYACAEHEFSIVNEFHYGANPFDIYNTFDDISNLKTECDYLIVLYHGGKEHYRYPSPILQKRCHAMIDSGADLIVTQHSHCIGCKENYKSGEIIYGQGNFLFDHQNLDCWQTSILISIDTETKTIDYIPLIKKNNSVRLADSIKANEILNSFLERSNDIKKSGFIDEKYKEFALENIDNYIASIIGKRTFGKIINKITKGWYYRLKSKRYCKKNSFLLYAFLNCEAHYELLFEGLKQILYKQ